MDKINVEKGESLVVELSGECFVGEFVFMNKDRSQIHLENVQDFYTRKQLVGTQIFYKPDIKSITPLKPSDKKTNSSIVQSAESALTNNDIEISNISIADLDEINKCICNLNYIHQTNNGYHKAISEMKNQEFISLSIEGVDAARNSQLSLVTIATRNTIYMFDIISLGKIHKDLKCILEAERPRKIVHDSSRIADNLRFKHNVELSSIFDTMVAHVALRYDKKPITLQKCISTHFNLPSPLKHVLKNIDWTMRPLTNEQKEIAAQNVAYLHRLQSYLMNEKMLKNFYKACTDFSYCYRHNDEIEVAFNISDMTNSSLENVEDFNANLNSVLDFDFISNLKM